MEAFLPYVSVISVALAIYAAIRTNRKELKEETKNDTVEMTTLIVKLENINAGINEIKSDFRTMKTDLDSLRERVARIDESTKAAHKRLDGHCAIDHGGQ